MKRRDFLAAAATLAASPAYPSKVGFVAPSRTCERVAEWTIESRKVYVDPFNDVDVDVMFTRDGQSWRVPTFWRGGQRWTVRFAPPVPGVYFYRLVSTDANNPDLNGHAGRLTVTAYGGPNALLRHGMLRVSANKRYFEQADGIPFYWLGDTWWEGLSTVNSWEDFQRVVGDRRRKGFTVMQICAGLVPHYPGTRVASGPRYVNEGGPVWDAALTQINPHYFDFADRRIQCLLDAQIVPALVGGWNVDAGQLGVGRMKQHWRYIVARYGAFPAFWILGGEVLDPPEEKARQIRANHWETEIQAGWTDIAKYVRAIDCYHHPLTAHEHVPPGYTPLQDESLTDFDMFQSTHFGWGSIAMEVTQMNLFYARTSITKPLVQGEIGYEQFGATHLQDFQRVAFWLSMLNGAAGHTYGTFVSTEEKVKLPGSQQVGLGAQLLKQYPWWQLKPHPDWITPRGTTLLEPNDKHREDNIGSWELFSVLKKNPDQFMDLLDDRSDEYAGAEWKSRHGTFRRPYAAGIPEVLRIVYIPYLGFDARPPPTILKLEKGIRYQAYFWNPSQGNRVNLGDVQRSEPGILLFEGRPNQSRESDWRYVDEAEANKTTTVSLADRRVMATLPKIHEANVVASLSTRGDADAALVLRYQDPGNFVAAVYSATERALYLLDRKNGEDGLPLGRTPIPELHSRVTLSAEVREEAAILSLSDEGNTYTSPIVTITQASAGSAGVATPGVDSQEFIKEFEIRRSEPLPTFTKTDAALLAESGPQHLLLDAYRPDRLPEVGDWVLILEARK